MSEAAVESASTPSAAVAAPAEAAASEAAVESASTASAVVAAPAEAAASEAAVESASTASAEVAAPAEAALEEALPFRTQYGLELTESPTKVPSGPGQSTKPAEPSATGGKEDFSNASSEPMPENEPVEPEPPVTVFEYGGDTSLTRLTQPNEEAA